MEQPIFEGLVARGMPPHIAQAFVMNFKDESGLNPGINEIAPIVPGSRGGYGLYQLTGPRRRAYEAYASERGLPLDSVDAQLDFMMTELQGPEANAWAKIAAAPDTGQAAAAVVNYFLRPAEEHRARRVARYTGGEYEPMTASGPSAAPGNAFAMATHGQPQAQPQNELAQPSWQYQAAALDVNDFMRPIAPRNFIPIA